jgi:hypothetical protein
MNGIDIVGFIYVQENSFMSLKSLIIEPTKKTPRIILEPGSIQMIGRSISENPGEVYRPVYEWVSEYASESTRSTEILLGFEFINTSSMKWVYAILKELAKIPDMPVRAKISWYYEEGDEDMCDLGIILRSLVNCPFQILEVDDINKPRFDQDRSV